MVGDAGQFLYVYIYIHIYIYIHTWAAVFFESTLFGVGLKQRKTTILGSRETRLTLRGTPRC